MCPRVRSAVPLCLSVSILLTYSCHRTVSADCRLGQTIYCFCVDPHIESNLLSSSRGEGEGNVARAFNTQAWKVQKCVTPFK